MRDAFFEQYPSELLDPELMPSIRLLSHVYKQSCTKEFAFVPWKFRMSVKLHEEQQMAKPAKRARSELSDLLFDDVPTREIPSSGGMGMYHCQQILGLLSTASALCGAAHLHTLRSYERAFMRFAFAKVGADSGLRGPNSEEMQHADRMLWSSISELCVKGFALDDAIHEVVDVRAGVSTWLQPRAAPVKLKDLNAFQALGRGRGGKGKGKGFGKSFPNTGKGNTGTPSTGASEREQCSSQGSPLPLPPGDWSETQALPSPPALSGDLSSNTPHLPEDVVDEALISSVISPTQAPASGPGILSESLLSSKGKILLDVCCGSTRPISLAALGLGFAVLSVDSAFQEPIDIMVDHQFELFHVFQSLPEHISQHGEGSFFLPEEVSQLRALFGQWVASQGGPCSIDWTVDVEQPYCLRALSVFSTMLSDPDRSLFPALIEGVPTGFDKNIPASNVFAKRPVGDPADVDLILCEGNWSSAEANPALLREMVAKEVELGFLQEVPLETALERWPDRCAVGKMSIVSSEGRPDRLVVDNSICNTNALCQIDETYTLPLLGSARASFPLRGRVTAACLEFNVTAVTALLRNSENAHKRDLHKVTGMIQWFLRAFPHLRPWVGVLYKDLHCPPATLHSIDPHYFADLHDCVDDNLLFVRVPAGTAIPLGAKLIDVRHMPSRRET
ncbi:Gapdh [Symbiodinium sp. CCMP2592]|nr:Gapdh [Symbiodinium sp. CCMP2592]